jgi:glycosyltransferase involved in cell wall biosynthesis
VVIPAYNYAQYLERAVRSALAQDYPALEVIIVDDGSTDTTPELGRRLAAESPAVRYVRQENAGLSAARNTGIRAASQPLVAFLDADDEWLPAMVSTLAAALHGEPAATVMAACDSFRVDSDGNALGEKATATRGDRYFSASDLLLKTRFMPSCALARREAFEKAGLFDTALRSSEDRDMWARLAAGGRVLFLDRPLVRIRKHGANMSRNAGRMCEAKRRVREKARRAGLVPLMPRGDIGFWLRLLAIDHFQAGWMYWDERRPARALWHALLSLLAWPLPLDHRDLHEPPCFRLRALLRFLRP